MSFKSQAQRRKFAELLVNGEISPQTYEEWNRETGARKLPERAKRASTGRPAPGRATRKRTSPARGRAKRKTTKRKTTKRK